MDSMLVMRGMPSPILLVGVISYAAVAVAGR